ncbi:hypothetical protein GOL39_30365 [Sinorhizobium medicae]|nr:hypothetical protein [Sinorhizobium medicae]
MVEKRPILTLKPASEVASAEEDVRIDLHTYDVLLPCRRYEISYKVALLGSISPTLEFLVRLLKSVDGIDEDEARSFFGYSRTEMEYVLSEGVAPGYVERRDSRLWLTTAGEGLFSEGGDEPAIFAVERRRKEYGFDQLSLSPERCIALDRLEMLLPDLSVDNPFGGGNPSRSVGERFRYFFRELGDRQEKRSKRRSLYSIDGVVPSDRYQIPVRIKVYCQTSSPTVPEIDLSSWRPDQELSDRPEVEKAVGEFVASLGSNSNPEADAHHFLMQLAPDFYAEYRLARGDLSTRRYWRYAASHQGEIRTDRKTIPMIGSLTTKDNMEKFFRLVDIGLRDREPPDLVISVSPQAKHWGATSLLRDTNQFVRQKLRSEGEDGSHEPDVICLAPGKPAKYLSEIFETVVGLDINDIPRAIEFYFIPGVAVVALTHAPFGVPIGIAAPLGFASFDAEVLERTAQVILDGVVRHIEREEVRARIEKEIAKRAKPLAAVSTAN